MAISARKNRVTGEIVSGRSLDYLSRPLIIIDGEPIRYWWVEITHQIPGRLFDGVGFLVQDIDVKFQVPTKEITYRSELVIESKTVISCRRSGRMMIEMFRPERTSK